MIAHEIANLADVKTDVARYYSRIGLLQPARNPGNGYREYTPRDVKRVCFIRKTKWLGFTLKDVKNILDEADAGLSPCHKVRSIISDRIVENQQRLERLQQIQEPENSLAANYTEILTR